jgi:hypothetical protein
MPRHYRVIRRYGSGPHIEEIIDRLTICANPLDSIMRADQLDAVGEVVIRQHRLEAVDVDDAGRILRTSTVRLLTPKWPPCPLGN